jgi:OPA family glycerol-3-phosphate transporter-like MFS transporter
MKFNSNVMGHSKEFRFRRFSNWFPLGITYAAFYMGRYNLNVSSKTMMDLFHLSKTDFGLIATFGFWTYALSVIFNGPFIADKIGGKKAILIGAVGAAAVNLTIGLLFLNGWQTKIILGMSLLYSANSYFQSFGALSVVKVNSSWFHVKERGIFGGIFGIMISSGYFLALTVGGIILSYFPWYYVFLIPSGLIFLMFIIDYFLIKDKPSEAGFGDFNTGDATSNDPDKDKPVDWSYLFKKVFSNPIILIIMSAEFCTGFVRQGLVFWVVPFLKEVHQIEHGSALYNIATIGITVGGIIGGVLCGFLSDKIFQSRRPPVAFIFYIGQIIFILMLGQMKNPVIAAYLVGVCCMFIFGVHGMLSGTASMDFGGTKAAATVTGLFDGIQYVASGFTGFLLGAGLDKFGWGAWTFMIIPFSIIGAILMTRVWNATPAKQGAR